MVVRRRVPGGMLSSLISNINHCDYTQRYNGVRSIYFDVQLLIRSMPFKEVPKQTTPITSSSISHLLFQPATSSRIMTMYAPLDDL